eukprot:CAMPEP_0118994578 /NCGR_PEP_ID=MMETSP1173-20130426/57031_1 /TAXON_ID=1034831 /ORGANISM="Rhizochromulina marina cf, Strain CCMP1243" /LENGTH=56 /DNA_ID=CAMNT_0006945879 /DNA_START=14 /DNA_END=180 /DNA_ORIENTATION=-
MKTFLVRFLRLHGMLFRAKASGKLRVSAVLSLFHLVDGELDGLLADSRFGDLLLLR